MIYSLLTSANGHQARGKLLDHHTKMTSVKSQPSRIRPVPAVTRTVAALRFLARSGSAQPLHAVAKAIDAIPSTCLHILRVLVSEGWVDFDPESKTYRLEVGMLSVGRLALKGNPFTVVAQSRMEELAEYRRIVVVGAQIIGQHMIVVAHAKPRLPLQFSVEIGSRMPAYISATGRCYAANGPQKSRQQLNDVFRTLRWDRRPSFEEWLGEIDEARARGWSLDDGNYMRGVVSVAAPVVMHSPMRWGVVAFGVREHVMHIGAERIGKDLKRMAIGIAVEMARRQ